MCQFGKRFDMFTPYIPSKTYIEISDFYRAWKSTDHYKKWKQVSRKREKEPFEWMIVRP